MQVRRIVVPVGVVVLALAGGCESLSRYIAAGKSAMKDTTGHMQERYGQSPYYNDEVNGIDAGKQIDKASRYRREAGSVRIYNETGEGLDVSLIGRIEAGGRHTEQWYANVPLDFVGSESGRNYGTFTVGPTSNGLIVVVTAQGIERR